MRIAFFGGTFDPPHCGHLRIAQAAADRLYLDKVLFAPVGRQPLKEGASSASFEDRVAMVRLAVEADARFEVSLEDAARSDGQPNYTIDVMTRLKKTLEAQDHLFCLIGADSFLDFPMWHRAAELIFLSDFIVASRPDFQINNLKSGLPQGVRIIGGPSMTTAMSALELTDGTRSSKLYILPGLEENISATEVRASISHDARGVSALPASVAEYIHAHHLYC